MRTSLLFICIVGLILISCSRSIFEVVQIPRTEEASYPYAQSEPSIAINPTDTNEVVAGAIMDEYYYSKDGGRNWTAKQLRSPYGVWGDPVLIFDTTGSLHYFHLASYKKTTHLDRIVCQNATSIEGPFDEGSFPAPNGTKVQDKHWMVVNPENNHIYMTWTQFDAYDSREPLDSSIIVFSKSVDQGKTWTNPKRISHFAGDCIDDDLTVEGAVPAIGKNGEIIVCWAGPKGLVMQISSDEGESWLPIEKEIEWQHGGWTLEIPGIYRANGLPILVSDLSNGPHHGTLYLNWADQRNGESDTDIWIMKSEDNGTTWSAPIRVNQDETERQQFFTWLTVDQSTGYLYCVYYDRRNHKDNKTDVYLSVSKDGGLTFSDYKVSDKPFLPFKEVFFGDYLNISAVNGMIRPIWPRMDNGKITLWTTIINQKQLN